MRICTSNILPDPTHRGPNPVSAARHLEQQMDDPNSLLLRGVLTRFAASTHITSSFATHMFTIGKPPNVPYTMSAHALCGEYTLRSCLLTCLQCVAVCCSVLQCAAVCCSVLQCVAVCCSRSCLLICAVGNGDSSMIIVVVLFELHTRCPSCAPRRVREFTNSSCCSVLKYVAGLLQCFVVCCSVLQCLEKSLARMRSAARDNLTNVL